MARGTSTDERREAVTYIAADDLPQPDDIDAAFEEWRTGFATGEEPGKLRAYQIPLDERGNPIATAKNQIRLGSWPIDLYGFDELCTMLIRDFMPPEKVLAVRLLGIRTGHAGLQFNKIVILKSPRFNTDGTAVSPAGESVTSLMKAIQDANERTLALVRSMQPPPQPDNQLERVLTLSQQLNAPMNALMAQLLPALIGRPAGGMDVSGLGALLDVATKIADLRGGGGSESTGNDIVDTIRAIIPIAKPALEAIPAILQSRAALPQARQPGGATPALAGPSQGVPRPMPVPGVTPPRPASPPPGSVPTQPAPAAVGVTPAPQIGDIPSEDQAMFAQLKPQIDSLCQMAAGGSDAIGAADLLFDNVIMELADDVYAKLADLIEGPNFITQAAVFNPAVLTHQAWFQQFQQQISKRYDDEEKPESVPTVPEV
jgi:hypothetical protein